MYLHGYDVTIKVDPNPEINSIKFRILFPALEFKINDKMLNLATASDCVSFAMSIITEFLKQNQIREYSEPKGDSMEYVSDIKADGFQDKKVMAEDGKHYVIVPLQKCEGRMDRFL